MDKLKNKLSEMKYDTMSIMSTISLKKVSGGVDEILPPQDDTILPEKTVRICKTIAVTGDLA